MAYLLTDFWPGATVDEYKASIAAVHPPGGLPRDGPTTPRPTTEASSSPPWESEEQSDRFVQDKLLPSMAVEGGFSGQPEERAEGTSDGIRERARVTPVPAGAKRRLMGRIARESHAGEGGVFGEALLFTQRSGQSGLLLFVQSTYFPGERTRQVRFRCHAVAALSGSPRARALRLAA